MSKILFGLVGLTIVCAQAFAPARTEALSCAAPEYAKLLAEGGGAAVGTVVSQEELGVITTEYGQQVDKVRLTFTLSKAWSSTALPKTLVAIQHVPVAVYGDNDIWGFRTRFVTGQKYVVYFDRQAGEYRTSIGACALSHTYPVDDPNYDAELAARMKANGFSIGYVPNDTISTFAASPLSGSSPLRVRFTGLQAGARIDFGDGVSGDWIDGVPSHMDHVYSAPGVYVALLRGYNGIVGSVTITVSGSPVSTPMFTASPLSGAVPLAVRIAGSVPGVYFGGVDIDFGDGSARESACRPGSSCKFTLDHVYRNPGTYTASLIGNGEGDGGVIGTATVYAVTLPGPDPFPGPAPLPVPHTCPQISRTLSHGSRGSDVTALQQYFISIGVLGSSSATGYFGPLTEGAVQEWQASRGIVSSGSPATTGWGVVGPRTRIALANCW